MIFDQQTYLIQAKKLEYNQLYSDQKVLINYYEPQ